MVDPIKLHFQISPSSGVPIYRQIVDQVKMGIALNRFRPGEYLPSVREVSGSLDVNPMTVSKAYSILEKSGVVESVRGLGMLVPPQAAAGREHTDRTRQLVPLLKEVINSARQLSLNKEDVRMQLDELWEDDRHE